MGGYLFLKEFLKYHLIAINVPHDWMIREEQKNELILVILENYKKASMAIFRPSVKCDFEDLVMK